MAKSSFSRSSKAALMVLSFVASLEMAGTAIAAKPAGLPGNYPTRPVRVIVGSAAGGGADALARLVTGKLSESWGNQFIVENIATGVGGILALQTTHKAAPDGYTLQNTSGSTFQNATFSAKLDFDVRKVFVPIAQLTISPSYMAFNPNAPFKTMKDMIAYAKANPGKVNFGSSGIGSGAHLAGELLGDMADIKLTHIPYKGAGQSTIDAIGGRIEIVFGSPGAITPHVKTGKLRGIGVTAARRMPAQPDVPTFDELGIKGYEYVSWIGWVGPTGVPDPIVRALNAEVNKILLAPEIARVLVEDGASANPVTPEQFRKNIADALNLVEGIIKKTGISLRD